MEKRNKRNILMLCTHHKKIGKQIGTPYCPLTLSDCIKDKRMIITIFNELIGAKIF